MVWVFFIWFSCTSGNHCIISKWLGRDGESLFCLFLELIMLIKTTNNFVWTKNKWFEILIVCKHFNQRENVERLRFTWNHLPHLFYFFYLSVLNVSQLVYKVHAEWDAAFTWIIIFHCINNCFLPGRKQSTATQMTMETNFYFSVRSLVFTLFIFTLVAVAIKYVFTFSECRMCNCTRVRVVEKKKI